MFGVLSLAPCYVNEIGRYVTVISRDIRMYCGRFVGPSHTAHGWSPCIKFRRGEDRKRKREKFYIYLDVTHTPPAGAGSTLKGKRKKEADTRRANGQKQRRGGRGTDGPPEPTYTAKRTWPKTAHTPKPHNTLRRGTRGELPYRRG